MTAAVDGREVAKMRERVLMASSCAASIVGKGDAGSGLCMSSHRSMAAQTDESVEERYGILPQCGKNSTVCDTRSDRVCVAFTL